MAYYLARRFSTTNVIQSVQVPAQVFGVEGRYATALYTASVKMKALDAVNNDVKTMQKILKTDKKFIEFLKDPIMNRIAKTQALQSVLTKLKFSEPTMRLMDVMGRNGQLGKTIGVFSSIETILDAHNGFIKCVIKSAKPLDASAEKELVGALQLFVKPDQKIIIDKKIDPSLIGGITVSIGDNFVDMSVASKIRNYRHILEKAL